MSTTSAVDCDRIDVNGALDTLGRELHSTIAARELGASFKGVRAAVRRLRGRETHRDGDLSATPGSHRAGTLP